jgi:RNA polymerase sigma factor (TIGR02999 family)
MDLSPPASGWKNETFNQQRIAVWYEAAIHMSDPTRKPVKNDAGRTVILMEVDRLIPDPENPRFASAGFDNHTNKLVKLMWEEMAVDEVATSIAANGFFQQDPLLVIPGGMPETAGARQRYVVVEGNRRLCAVLLLRNRKLREFVKAAGLPTLNEKQISDLGKLPVAIFDNREELWEYYGRASSSAGEITLMLQAIRRGDGHSSEELLPLVYNELRHLAAARMAQEAAGQTLQATALVHEAWLRMVGDDDRGWQNRAHFFGAAAEAMRRILVENARRKSRLKRGGGQIKVDIDDLDLAAATPNEKVLLINEALERLRAEDSEKARIVVMKFFGGLTNQEVAENLGVTERTVERHWAYAKAWLFQSIRAQS